MAIVYAGVLATVLGLAWGARLYATNAQSEREAAKAASVSLARAEKAARVKVIRVFPQLLVDTLRLPGTVEASDDIQLAAKIGGTVEWMGYDEGDEVKPGDELLKLDVKAIAAQVERARANYELAKQKYDRLHTLYKTKVSSVEEYNDAEATLRVAKAALDEAQTNLAYGTLKSPVAGRVDRRMVDPGEHIAMGQTVLRLVNIETVKVMVNVPEKDALYFEEGQKAVLRLASGGEERQFEGVIAFKAWTADAATRTFPLKIVAENPEHALRPGMIVRVDLVRRRAENAIAVPFFTIVDRENGKAVFVEENNVARERPIQYGAMESGMVEIVSGLEIGDKLIVVGQRDLVDGEPVEEAADLTEMAQAYQKSGKDLASLAMELLHAD